jgi:3-hydroxyisobutyrate dehydrogenase
MTTRLGFVGLGRMGGPMSARLTAAGHDVATYDSNGSGSSGSLAQAASARDAVLLSLPDGRASLAVCGEIAAIAEAARTVIDLSTIGIAAAERCFEILAAAGIGYVDAPVSGGVAGAGSGSLAMMVGAPESVLAPLRPVLSLLAANIFRMGDRAGQGQAMKLLNKRLIVDVLNASSGMNTATRDKFPRSIIPGGYDFGFAAALQAKDVGLYLDSARAAGEPDAVASVVSEIWQRFAQAEPGADFTAIYRFINE